MASSRWHDLRYLGSVVGLLSSGSLLRSVGLIGATLQVWLLGMDKALFISTYQMQLCLPLDRHKEETISLTRVLWRSETKAYVSLVLHNDLV